MTCLSIYLNVLLILEDDSTVGGGRYRNVVEAIRLTHLFVQRSTHDIPHYHFNALSSCFANEISMGQLCIGHGVMDQIIEKALVKIRVYDTCALATKLV